MFTSTRRALTTTACTLGMLALAMGPASAGEITGTGELMEVQGHSECAFSGLNDGYFIPSHMEGPWDTSRVQNYGHTKDSLPSFLPKGIPGYACNPSGKRILSFPE